jgi:hypothetical protein
MKKFVRIAPPNSIFFISDVGGGEIPKINGGARIWWTASCVVIGCLAFIDGETEVTLGRAADVGPNTAPFFDGMLDTPKRNVTVSTVEDNALLQLQVLSKRTRVRIWTNRIQEPDVIVIGVG